MLTKTRSDFWKCRASIQIEEKCYEQCGRINASGHSCKCGNFSSTTDSPATNVEVLIAWLLADDERRREIEIASRPTKAGNYLVATKRGSGMPRVQKIELYETEHQGLCYQVRVTSYRSQVFRLDNFDGGLWEPTE